jgi:hypothetical protein
MKRLFKIIILSCVPFVVCGQNAGTVNSLLNKINNTPFFTENLGQVVDQNWQPRVDVLFGGVVGNMVFHLRKTGISYQLGEAPKFTNAKDTTKRRVRYRLDLEWVNCNTQCVIKKEGMRKDYNNFYDAPYPNGITHVKSFGKVIYQQLYSNIDLMFYGKENLLKYDLVVKPGGDPSQIQLNVEGATAITLQDDGSILIKTPLGNVHEGAPVAYQDSKKIPVQWSVRNNSLSFKLGAYDSKKVLIIDPAVRLWGTFYGTSGSELGNCVATDTAGCVYMAGDVNVGASTSGTIIATTGSFQDWSLNQQNPFLVKFDPNGVRLWGTYYGGQDYSIDAYCCVDSSGNVFLSGNTTYTAASTNTYIASVGAHQTLPGGAGDAFLAKFDANGVRLWGTFYGGTALDKAIACTTDRFGNVFLVGSTSSSGGTVIATPGTHQPTMSGPGDGYVVKFNGAGIRQWGTYYGGTAGDDTRNCSADTAGNIFIVGHTSSFNGISTPGCHQPTAAINVLCPYVAKLNKNGIRKWGTYYCGTSTDYVDGCATDRSGNVFVTGAAAAYTNNAISSPSAFQSVCNGNADAYLVKFDTAGIRLWGTYIGGTGSTNEEAYGCATDAWGNVFVAGVTTSSNYISTPGVHQYTFGGGIWDGFLMKFDSNGNRQWGTYYGGPQNNSSWPDKGKSCATDKFGNVFFTGHTDYNLSDGTFNSPGCHQPSPGSGGNPDAFLAKFNNCPNMTLTVTPSANWICPSQSTTITSASAYPNFLWSDNTTDNNIVVSPSVTTSYTVSSSSPTVGCVYYSVFTLSVTNLNVSTGYTICANKSATISASGANSYTWSTSANTSSIIVSPSVTTVYTLNANNNGGCIVVKTITVTVLPNPTVTATSFTSCVSGVKTATANGANSYSWSTGSNLNTATVSVPSGTAVLTVTGTAINGCQAVAQATIIVYTPPFVTLATSNNSLCAGIPNYTPSVVLTASGADTYTWINPPSNSNPLTVSLTTTTTYSVIGTKTINGCNSLNPSTITVFVTQSPTVSISSGTICAGQSFNLNPQGAQSYLMQGPIVSPTVTTNYNCTGVTNNCGSVNTATATVVVLQTPTLTVSASSNTVCSGETVTLTTGGANTYTWSNSSNSQSITVTPTSSTSYSVVGQAANTCTSASIKNITVDLPVITVVSSASLLCDGQSATITANGANTYTWSTNVTGNQIVVSPTSTTTYTVYGTSAFGCDTNFAFTQNVVSCTGIQSNNLSNSFQIYPNPNMGAFQIEISSELIGTELRFYNNLGQLIKTQKLESAKNKIQINVASGVYYYHLNTQNSQSIHGKFVIE